MKEKVTTPSKSTDEYVLSFNGEKLSKVPNEEPINTLITRLKETFPPYLIPLSLEIEKRLENNP